ncbi:MAG: hypothetical protein JNJ61_01580 [Anaerolineae bacterium]|nr:hypothetical protein [Anaerolineae bacterium]
MLYCSLLSVILLAACQPAAPLNAPPTAIPFPTMTPGRVLRGPLATVPALPLDGGGLANPATAVALANLPTPTPSYGACPPSAAPPISARPATGREMSADIAGFLSAGGSAAALDQALRNDWDVLGDSGVVRGDVDFTGEGAAEVIVSYNAPDEGGTLLILSCISGLYAPLYQSNTGGPAPQIILAGDMTFDRKSEVLFTSFVCADDSPDDCAYRSQLLTWNGAEGRFVSLLNRPLGSTTLPSVGDPDNDSVLEVIVRLDDPGSETTGPLRTGVNIYDWDGSSYVLSIVQLDPPRFQIQIIHEADQAFARLEADQAISLYELALSDTALRFWLNDEPFTLKSYAYYRLLLAYAYTEDDQLLPTYQAALQAFPDPATAPVYVAMVSTFWNAWQLTNNLNSACRQVQALIAQRPEAVTLLNRYGSRSPVYSAQDLCPF